MLKAGSEVLGLVGLVRFQPLVLYPIRLMARRGPLDPAIEVRILDRMRVVSIKVMLLAFNLQNTDRYRGDPLEPRGPALATTE